MKNNVFFSIILLLLLSCLIVESCTKEENDINSNLQNGLELSTRTSYLNDPPSKSGDKLIFRDMNHFKQFYISLDSLFNDLDAYDAWVQSNDQINSIYYRLLNDSYVTFSEAYKPFLTDPIMQTIVNENYEFQIGDTFYVYMNNEEILFCDATNARAISDMRSMPKGVKVDISSIPSDIVLTKDDEIEAWVYPCQSTLYIAKKDCDSIVIFGFCRKFYFWGEDVDIYVVYSNSVQQPSLQQFLNSSYSWSENGAFSITLPITGLQNGSYIHVMADPDCPASSGYNTFAWYEVEQYYCDPGDHDTGLQSVISANGLEQMLYQVSNYTGILGTNYEFAKIKSMTWAGTKYEPSKAELALEIDVTRKDWVCNDQQNEEEEDDCSNCKKRTVKLNNFSLFKPLEAHYCDGDVVASFEKIRSGITLTHNVILDFEDCCE